VLLTQLAPSVLCTRCHSVDQHLCRWLLDSLDRMSSNELTATHESIANMLGVRRESVTASAGKLKDAGLISSRRGHIRVLNREALVERACECYQVVKREFDGLLALSNNALENEGGTARTVVTRRIAKPAVAYRHPAVNSNSATFGRASSL
jgi:DNA-binding transcriptional MocR family regulator